MFFRDETFEEFVQSLLTRPRYFESATLCCRKRRDHHASTNCGVQGHPDHFLPWERIDTWNRMTEQSLRSRDLLEKGLVVRKLLDIVSNYGFKPFAYWRIIVGSVGLALLMAIG